MKNDRLLDDIKSRLDIIEVISDYVQLKKAGQNHKGLCPFHAEKTPSFMVSQSKQIFHCFGCSSGGDIFGFVMKYENLSFNETVKLLAKRAGIVMTGYRFDGDSTEKKEQLSAIQKEALDFFTEKMKKTRPALAYLTQRGVSEEMIKAFSLGYADKEWRTLFKYIKQKKYEEPLLLQSGLFFSGEKGFYDIFRNRIIFPIFNIHGDPIAFGGRALDDSMPKYLNSTETPLFKKGETLYALHMAKEEIRKKGYIIVAEGYLDVIMCHQHGFKNVVAPLGTALTSAQLQKLGRFTKKIVLVFDSDAAGIAAAKRSIALLYEHGFRGKVLLLPEGDDPDSFLRKNGGDAFKTRLAKARTMVDFILSLKGERTDNIRTAINIISGTKDLIVKEEMYRELSEKSGVKEAVLRKESMKESGRASQRTGRDEQHSGTNRPLASDRLACKGSEMLLLSALVTCPDRAKEILDALNLDFIHNSTVKEIFKKTKPFADNLNVNTMLSVLTEEEKNLVTRLTLNPGFDIEDVDRNIRDCLKKISQHTIQEKIQQAPQSGDLSLLTSLLSEKHQRLKEEENQ